MDGLFKNTSNQANEQNQAALEESLSMIKDVMRRLRLLEERYSNMRKSHQVNEQNNIAYKKKMTEEVKGLEADIVDLKKMIRQMGDEIKILVKEVKDTVKKDEVKLLEKYINFWQPLNFVTHNELQNEIKKQLKKELSKKEEKEEE